MFEDLRQQADHNDNVEEKPEEEDNFLAEEAPRQENRLFLGMTAPQRFVITTMLFVWACVISFFVLFVMEKVMPF